MSNPHKITPCLVCQSTERAEGDYWKPVCKQHEPIWHLCCSGAADGIMRARTAPIEDLNMAFNYMLKKGGQSTLLKAIAREIKKRLKAHKPADGTTTKQTK